MRYEEIATRLVDQGWCVTPGFLPAEQVHSVLAQARVDYESGRFQPAAVGHGTKRQVNAAVRHDEICWLEGAHAVGSVANVLDAFEVLRSDVNAHCLLGLFDFELHFSRYAPGGAYARHLDRFHDDTARVLSCVLYLNEDWTGSDGGELRLFTSAESDAAIDVLPVAGTLVTFLSDKFPHEVLPARRERWSITGWFRNRP